MYRARDRVENEEWLARMDRAADSLELGTEARSVAVDLFLSHVPDAERSKPAVAAASIYAGSLIVGEERSQSRVATTMEVSRLAVQTRWKELLRDAGFQPPEW
ncbi:transcription initiation factor IIB family protein [Salinigranum marinum]|uniref:transcription initiation factor IIB family protein n=1 Tax=Salinigranum marinum TaxID=1515595 RepID=UPI002989DEC2|nr:transcription initiation factor IIB family protein [Salinigranum marinum]